MLYENHIKCIEKSDEIVDSFRKSGKKVILDNCYRKDIIAHASYKCFMYGYDIEILSSHLSPKDIGAIISEWLSYNNEEYFESTVERYVKFLELHTKDL